MDVISGYFKETKHMISNVQAVTCPVQSPFGVINGRSSRGASEAVSPVISIKALPVEINRMAPE